MVSTTLGKQSEPVPPLVEPPILPPRLPFLLVMQRSGIFGVWSLSKGRNFGPGFMTTLWGSLNTTPYRSQLVQPCEVSDTPTGFIYVGDRRAAQSGTSRLLSGTGRNCLAPSCGLGQ